MSIAAKIGFGAGGFALLAFGGLLWVRHGEGVFFDMLAAGFAYCFL